MNAKSSQSSIAYVFIYNPWNLTRVMVVANLDMATFDTEPRPLMYCV